MSRFFVSPQDIKEGGKEIVIKGKETHHLCRVMRLRKGESVVVFDGTGKEYEGIIKQISPQSSVIEVKKICQSTEEERTKIALAQAIPKKAKMAEIIDKTTQLGVSEIIPMITERTVSRPKDRSLVLKRWQRVAIESCKQSGRTELPYIYQIIDFKEAVSLAEQYDIALMPCLLGERRSLKELSLEGVRKIIFFIGPEGGFTQDEIAFAKQRKVVLLEMGKRVLRTDTAAIAMVAILTYATLRKRGFADTY